MIRRIFLLLAVFAGAISLPAQQFQNKFEIPLPDTISQHELVWADFDNDSLLDVIVIGHNAAGNKYFSCYRNDKAHGLVWTSAKWTNIRNASFLLADADLDNDIDILLSGERNTHPVTILMRNDGNFTFTEQLWLSKAGRVIKLGDLDDDGIAELVLSGEVSGNPYLTIFKNRNNTWEAVHDSLRISATSVEVFDFDHDDRNDLFVSGKDAQHQIVTTVYYNSGHFYFKPSVMQQRADGITTLADLDHNGHFDLVLSGTDALAKPTTIFLLNGGKTFRAVKDSIMVFSEQRVFAADLDSNGKCDLHFHGKKLAGERLSIVHKDDRSVTDLSDSDTYEEAFGDHDRDGDLDLIQSKRTPSGLKLVLADNKIAQINHGPARPANAIGVRLFDRLFLYWDKSVDDHTLSNSITYDIKLRVTNDDHIMGEFDEMNLRRLTVSHGNNGPKNFLLLKNVPGDQFGYTVQPIDNAFHTQKAGICIGGALQCNVELQASTIDACENERVELTGASRSLWFSFTDGYLGEASAMRVKAGAAADTLFSVDAQNVTGCAAIAMYIVKPSKNLTKKIVDSKFVCEGKPLLFDAGEGWSQIEWRSSTRGILSTQRTISYTPQQNDTLKLKTTNAGGCTVMRHTAISISKPAVVVNGEVFQILKGEDVQLVASGGDQYVWSPANGLSNSSVADPVASPSQTTQYIVTAKDSLGCEASASVLVMVVGTAFVPNLFTPNDDGKNDELRIYGLGSAKDFVFTIHNREGNVVFETRDVIQAVSMGWDGSVRGNKQPSGVYYWKVSGEQAGGRRLLLNGKTSGSIVLIR